MQCPFISKQRPKIDYLREIQFRDNDTANDFQKRKFQVPGNKSSLERKFCKTKVPWRESSRKRIGRAAKSSVRPMLMSDIWHRRIGGNWTHRRWKGNGAPTADAPNLQRRVYDVAAAATECNQTRAHCAREAVIKCNAWRHHCVRRVLVLNRWAARRPGNSLSCHSCSTALYENGTTDVRMKLTDLTS